MALIEKHAHIAKIPVGLQHVLQKGTFKYKHRRENHGTENYVKNRKAVTAAVTGSDVIHRGVVTSGTSQRPEHAQQIQMTVWYSVRIFLKVHSYRCYKNHSLKSKFT